MQLKRLFTRLLFILLVCFYCFSAGASSAVNATVTKSQTVKVSKKYATDTVNALLVNKLARQQAYNILLRKQIAEKEEIISFSKRLLFFRNTLAVITVSFFIIVIINNRKKVALNKVLQQQNADIALQTEEISRQKEKLDQVNHTKDQLFSVISHDLRSPFAAILQSIDLMRSGQITDEEHSEVVEGFYQQINLVTIMVNNLLAWANSQQFGITSDMALLNIVDVINQVVHISNFLAKNKAIKLIHHDKTRQMACVDLNQVKIIVQNLIGNAIKFTPTGGTVEIFYTREDGYLLIHIKDNGIGIPAEKMKKLFKVAGKEISGYGTNNETGAGIGLVLIKQFVEANDGRLKVESKTGEGSEFIVYLKKPVVPVS